MKNDIADLKAYAEKLRTDLIATNLVLTSIVGTLPPEQHLGVLRAIAQLSVMQEQSVGELQTPAAAMKQLQQSIQRHHDQLQGLYKMRKDVP
ncbi:MAG: hypothetical protein Q8R67_04485 [Rhodoferax sp.]|nr:hypothetical protein [Rhodoferax sp.]MDP3650923.1 hypothetical protein [Rhodoferax sp.]